MRRSSDSASYSPSLQREQELQLFGYNRIAGIDEAGRGPLAGPVVAGAVVLPASFNPTAWTALTDSKQVDHAIREELYERITPICEWGVGIVDVAIIDEVNIRQASWRAMQLAVNDLHLRSTASGIIGTIDFALIDGLDYGAGPWPYEALVKGDSRSFSIAAASIVAKVTRDRIMIELDKEHAGYGFATHKGYGTPEHLEALQKLGPCAIHRRTFAPVQRLLEPPSAFLTQKPVA